MGNSSKDTSTSATTNTTTTFDVSPALQCASNKWKVPVELSKLEIPQVVNNSLSFDNNNTNATTSTTTSETKTQNLTDVVNEDTLLTPIILPSSDFHILFIPYESEQAKIRKIQYQQKQQEQQQQQQQQSENTESSSTTFLEES